LSPGQKKLKKAKTTEVGIEENWGFTREREKNDPKGSRRIQGLLEDIRLLKSDETNPNKMTSKQKEQVWKSLQKHGWIYPVVTDLKGVFGDGEQRVQVCRDHGEFFAPVLRGYLSRILRGDF
jgi:hypothetical protein